MADKSITGLTAAGTITGAELVKVVQGGNSRKAALSAIISALAPVGIDGEDGRTVLNGTTVPDGGIGVDGDFYLRTTNYVIYGPKLGGDWGSGVSLVGPPGADGADGADGLDGVDGQSLLNGDGAPSGALGNDGDMYLDYTNYDIYGPKTAGAWGSGTSLLGTVGSDGKTILNGTVDPTTEGSNGDFYLNTVTSTLFGPKAAGTWPTGVSLIGADGLDGVDGIDGRTILYGTSAPTTEGEDGDFYIRITTNFIYGPKASGAWPAGVSLVGPTGASGKTVLSGSGVPSNALGSDGDFYIDTANLQFYGPKASGAWGSASSIVGITDAPNDGNHHVRRNLAWETIPRELTINTQASSYTLALTDRQRYIRMTSATGVNLTIPPNASVAFPVGTIIQVRQAGAGKVTIVAGSGVTINTPETLLMRKQGSTIALIKVDTNTWDLTGDLEAI